MKPRVSSVSRVSSSDVACQGPPLPKTFNNTGSASVL